MTEPVDPITMGLLVYLLCSNISRWSDAVFMWTTMSVDPITHEHMTVALAKTLSAGKASYLERRSVPVKMNGCPFQDGMGPI